MGCKNSKKNGEDDGLVVDPTAKGKGFKVILVGELGVGKSCLILRTTKNMYSETPNSTIGVDKTDKDMVVSKTPVKLQIWDTAGQERFHRTITSAFYRRAQIIILVYDITSAATFQAMDRWWEETRRNTDNAVFVLAGNKLDKESDRTVPTTSGKEFAQKHNIDFFEVSALSGAGVEAMFTEAAKKALLASEQKS
jgi:small GTP-binding protein